MSARARLTYLREGQPVEHLFQSQPSSCTRDHLAASPLELTLRTKPGRNWSRTCDPAIDCRHNYLLTTLGVRITTL